MILQQAYRFFNGNRRLAGFNCIKGLHHFYPDISSADHRKELFRAQIYFEKERGHNIFEGGMKYWHIQCGKKLTSRGYFNLKCRFSAKFSPFIVLVQYSCSFDRCHSPEPIQDRMTFKNQLHLSFKLNQKNKSYG